MADSLHVDAAVFIATTASGALGETQVGGDISLNVRNIAMRDSILDLTGPARNGTFTVNADTFRTNFTFIQSLTAFQQGGNITVNARVVELTNGSAFISTTLGDGNAGDIQITATDHVRIVGDDGTSLFATVQPSGLFSNSFGDFSGLGNAGNITITTPRLELLGGRINTVTQTSGRGGNVTLNVSESISISGEFPTSALLIPAIFDIGPLAPSGIVTSTIGGVCPGPCGKAGDISITTGSLSIQNGGRIDSGTSSNGPGGNIALSATDVISLSGTSRDGTPVGLFSRSIGTDPDSGSGGNIELHAGQYQVTNGAQVSASTLGPGTAGNVFLEGASGPAQTVLIDGFGSGIFTDTQGTGAGGNILMNANTITLQNGGTLSATTSGTATSASGGTITVNANQVQVNSGGLITASTTGAGAGGSVNINAGSTFSSNAGTVSSTASQATGGDITITAGQSVTLTNGANISASSTGAGNAGNIQINAGNQFAMTNSTVTTEANQASGGAIKITTNPNGTVQLTDSTISASVLDGTGGGGSVNIDPQYVVLQNSQILANAVFGPGGNINITTNLLLPDSTSLISASSQFGQQGTIIIQSPISPASGKIVPLGQKPLLATTLLSQRCAALAGGNASSFTVAGRDALPVEPGGWLSSPLALTTGELVGSTATEPETRTSLSESTEEMPVVSLRRIAPPGFLTQSFAADGTTGCTS